MAEYGHNGGRSAITFQGLPDGCSVAHLRGSVVSAGGGGRNTYPALARHPYRGEHIFTCARRDSAILGDKCGVEFGTHHDDCAPRQP